MSESRIDVLIPPELREGTLEVRRQARLLVLLALSMGITLEVGVLVSIVGRGPNLLAGVLALGGAGVGLSFVLTWLTRSVGPATAMLVTAGGVPLSVVTWEGYGPSGPAALGFLLLPVIGFVVGARRVGLVCTAFTVGQMALLYAAERSGVRFPLDRHEDQYVTVYVATVMLVAVVLTGFLWWYDAAWRRARADGDRALEDLAEVNRQLAAARDAALHASDVKSRFLATMSHELRTPMNAIIGYTELLQEQATSDLDQEDIQRILWSSRHLLALVDDVLDMAKIEAEKLDLVLSRFSVRTVVREVVESMQGPAARNDNRLSAELPDESVLVLANPTRLRQVLANLLSNACKFTSSGQIRVTARRTDSELVIAVSDTGRGMSPEDQLRCFLPFEQARGTVGGTGLGLAISRRLCQLMGGDLTVQSELGVGSTFEVTLPGGAEPAVEIP